LKGRLGNVDDVGDWEMKYERMGELGAMFLGGDGVCGFEDEELAESDDETDNERDLWLFRPMGMGFEQVWFDFSFEDI
jgi:hypothetical protein